MDLNSLTQPLLLRGDMNDWGTDLVFEAQPDGTHTLSLALAPGMYGFKIATADWSEADLGAMNGSYQIALGQDAAIAPSRDMLTLDVAIAGSYQVVLEQREGQLFVVVSQSE